MSTHHLLLVGLFVGMALFAYWFNFIVGAPLADPEKVNPRAILFWLPYLLAKRRLKGSLFDQQVESWRQQLHFATDVIAQVQAQRDHRLNTVLAGRELFGWETALFCPVCLHWWLCVAAWFLPLFSLSDLPLWALLYLITHLLTRKI